MNFRIFSQNEMNIYILSYISLSFNRKTALFLILHGTRYDINRLAYLTEKSIVYPDNAQKRCSWLPFYRPFSFASQTFS